MRRMDSRGRLTIPDVVYVLLAVFFIGGLWPVFHTGLRDNLGELPTGAVYLFQLILPLGVLVLFYVVFAKAVGGVQ